MFIATTYDLPNGKTGVHILEDIKEKSTFDKIVEHVEASATRTAAFLFHDDGKLIDAYYRSSSLKK